MDESKPLSEEGYALMGAVFEVHKEQGGGLLEEIYQESLEIELQSRSIKFVGQPALKTYYKGVELKKRYVPDLMIQEGIVVELKSVAKIAPEHEAQLLNYMRITKFRVGYLVNFGPVKQVEWKRFVL